MNPDITLPQLPVLDSGMAYREAGPADAPVALFLHGNPTSSYIWRNIIPHIAPRAHCIAPDLIGFGQSGKPDIAYRFEDHVRYLDAFIAEAGIGSAYIVAQDWGTALAFHLAARRPDFVRGLVFMEFIRPIPNWDEFLRDSASREIFRKFRTPGEGEKLILEDNAFVERVLPGSIVRKLTDEEMAVYRAPFATPQSRRPTWRFPNELPIAGEPADVYASLERAHAALASSRYPKLLFAAEPGALVSPAFAECFARGLHDCGLVQLGAGVHYLQEDHPDTIGRSIAAWIVKLEAAADRGGVRDIEFHTSFDDQAQIAGLYRAAALGERSPEAIVEAFRNSKYKVFALRQGRLVGAGRAFGDEIDCAVICDLAVHPDLQANGLGEKILETLKQSLRHHLRIILYAKPGKERFYLNRGFSRMRTAMLSSFVVPAERNREAGMIE
jgi:haloalkane dehalogenase